MSVCEYVCARARLSAMWCANVHTCVHIWIYPRGYQNTTHVTLCHLYKFRCNTFYYVHAFIRITYNYWLVLFKTYRSWIEDRPITIKSVCVCGLKYWKTFRLGSWPLITIHLPDKVQWGGA